MRIFGYVAGSLWVWLCWLQTEGKVQTGPWMYFKRSSINFFRLRVSAREGTAKFLFGDTSAVAWVTLSGAWQGSNERLVWVYT